jgi:hypothetical protein
MIASLKTEIEAAQRQALQLQQEREICDREISLLSRHFARQCGSTLSDIDTFSASLRRRRRIDDELKLTTRQVVAMRRQLVVQRGYSQDAR